MIVPTNELRVGDRILSWKSETGVSCEDTDKDYPNMRVTALGTDYVLCSWTGCNIAHLTNKTSKAAWRIERPSEKCDLIRLLGVEPRP